MRAFVLTMSGQWCRTLIIRINYAVISSRFYLITTQYCVCDPEYRAGVISDRHSGFVEVIDPDCSDQSLPDAGL